MIDVSLGLIGQKK